MLEFDEMGYHSSVLHPCFFVPTFTTRTCQKHGHPEITFEVSEQTPEVDAEWLRDHLESSVAAGARFRPGQRLQIGWMALQVATLRGGWLTLHEPDFQGVPVHYVPGVSHTLSHLRQQRAVAASVGLEAEVLFPLLRQPTIVCEHYAEASHLWMERFPPRDEDDSGWFIGCADPTHDHEKTEALEALSLFEVALHQSAVIPYLALPPGAQVLLPVLDAPCPPAEGLANLRCAVLFKDEVELRIAPGSFLELWWRHATMER